MLQPFTEEAVVRGLGFATDDGTVAAWGRGAIFADLDQDGDPDIVATGRASQVVGIFENDGAGNFSEVLTTIGPLSATVGVISADFDNDSFPDLYLIRWHEPNVLLRNLGGFQFVDVTATAGVGDPGATTGCCWADYDLDGFVDLYVTNYTGNLSSVEPNMLYRNQGDGTFTPVGGALGVAVDYFSFQSIFFDMDRDGDPDLYVANGKSGAAYRENNLFENDGAGGFIDRTFTAGTAAYIDSMGLGVGDFDGNGFLDLYCTNVPFGNPLFMNQGGGVFNEESGPAGVAAYRFGWSAHFLDFDNDTHMDLHVCNWNTPNLLYRHTGAFPAVDIADAVGLITDGDDSTSSSIADVDLDGDVDILVTALDQPLRLFINQEGQDNGWIAVELKNSQTSGNLHAIGATIDVTAGGVTRTRYVGAGEGFRGQNSFVQSFGIGSATNVDEIHVIWPGGDETSVFDVLSGQRVVVTPTGILDAGFVRGDVSGGGSVDVADAVAALAYLFLGGNASCLDAADFDDNGTVDVSDPVAILAFLFTGGPPPAAPYPSCGADLGVDALGCSSPPCP